MVPFLLSVCTVPAVSLHGEIAPSEFTPTSTTKKRQHHVRMMKQKYTKHVYFLFFNPLEVTGKLKVESLGWVLGGDELAMGRNRYHSSVQKIALVPCFE